MLATTYASRRDRSTLPVPWAVRSGPRPSAGFVPTPHAVVDGMLAAAQVRPGEMVYDLGCGDGRIVIAAARKFGARGVGFDLDVELIQAARAGAAAAGVRHSVAFRRADLFTVDLSPADVVTLYLLREVNAQLLPQLKQLRPGARVVSRTAAKIQRKARCDANAEHWAGQPQGAANRARLSAWGLVGNFSRKARARLRAASRCPARASAWMVRASRSWPRILAG